MTKQHCSGMMCNQFLTFCRCMIGHKKYLNLISLILYLIFESFFYQYDILLREIFWIFSRCFSSDASFLYYSQSALFYELLEWWNKKVPLKKCILWRKTGDVFFTVWTILICLEKNISEIVRNNNNSIRRLSILQFCLQ